MHVSPNFSITKHKLFSRKLNLYKLVYHIHRRLFTCKHKILDIRQGRDSILPLAMNVAKQMRSMLGERHIYIYIYIYILYILHIYIYIYIYYILHIYIYIYILYFTYIYIYIYIYMGIYIEVNEPVCHECMGRQSVCRVCFAHLTETMHTLM